MDKNFDERLTKLETVLAGLERLMNGFKNEIINEESNTDNNTNNDNLANENNTESETKMFNKKDVNEKIDDILKSVTDKQPAEHNIDDVTDVDKLQKSNLDVQSINLADDELKEEIKEIDDNDESTSEDPELNQVEVGNYRELNNRLASIEVLLKEISFSIQNLKPKGFYKNWEAKHQMILSCSFTPKDVFNSVLWKMSRQMDNEFTGESSVNRLFDSLPTFRVSRTSRFPSDGVYVDLNDYDIYNQCQRIREGAYCCKHDGARNIFKTALAYLHNLVLCDPNDTKVAGIMYDLQSFEQKLKLEWADN